MVEPAPLAVTVDFYHDVTCPWSFIGKRRLDRVLQAISAASSSSSDATLDRSTPPPVSVRADFHPFFINPSHRLEGAPASWDARSERVRREVVKGRIERLKEVAREDGVQLKLRTDPSLAPASSAPGVSGHAEPDPFDRPKTLKAHRLVLFARDEARRHAASKEQRRQAANAWVTQMARIFGGRRSDGSLKVDGKLRGSTILRDPGDAAASKMLDLLASAYWERGEDIGNDRVLVRWGKRVGLDAHRVGSFLSSNRLADAVLTDEQNGRRLLGITGSPWLKFSLEQGGRTVSFDVAGAQDVGTMLRMLSRAFEKLGSARLRSNVGSELSVSSGVGSVDEDAEDDGAVLGFVGARL
ncbi:hypothetical protein M427DRAFT_69283 [Gonapodya prolifera JEL478]|uniref:DSBA-like thioredoxin domain-containing protein n=1 Tax=Gonapodya prolifera (strain JEL478) TaxID=1344416 RepID=A0A139AHQ1_GONPJ|nr:hypothetical protein M427DRAFT_69283 [Gonapodya prolifera JEL478]|eukprot:KXS16327.1 hypothetical protein M427DRAFT_69283 [Gonapodya prolifera JEL478]